MDLIDKEIIHQTFGAGKVTNQTGSVISVEFSEKFGVKRFKYPSAFETFLSPSDARLKDQIAQELMSVKEKAEAEKKEREESKEAAKLEEQKATAERKKTASKKRAPSKPKAKEAKKDEQEA